MISGVWRAVMKLILIIAQTHFFLTSDSRDNDLQLHILLKECPAVVSSIRTCVSLTLPHKLCKSKKLPLILKHQCAIPLLPIVTGRSEFST